MKIARFSVDGWESYGLVEGDRVRVIQGNIFAEHKDTHPVDSRAADAAGVGSSTAQCPVYPIDALRLCLR